MKQTLPNQFQKYHILSKTSVIYNKTNLEIISLRMLPVMCFTISKALSLKMIIMVYPPTLHTLDLTNVNIFTDSLSQINVLYLFILIYPMPGPSAVNL